MERTRIVLMHMSPLLRDIIRETVDRDEGLDVVAELDDGGDQRATLEQIEAELVIVGPEAPPGTGASIVASQRVVRALEVDEDGHSVLHELVPNRVGLGELSPDALLSRARAVRRDQ